MAEHTILLIEKEGSRAPTFAAALERKGYAVQVAPTGSAALHSTCAPALIILNAPSLGSSGTRICRLLRQKGVPIIHILPGDARVPAGEAAAEVYLPLPFTPRKLINCVKRLMPVPRREVIAAGPIHFVPEARVVQAYGRETRLTPRAASLLRVFLAHPGETLDRGYLMRQVWKTDYVGDTRTLDVHVRWVRQAIEVEPASPRHLLTQRGVGYRFVPEPDSLKPGG